MSQQLTFFSIPASDKNSSSSKQNYGKPRLNCAVRNQVEMKTSSIDDLLPKEHLARDIWQYVENLDLSILLNQIQSIEGNVGRSAIDPKILLSLWLYATVKGISSARVLDEHCERHDAFKWICGGVSVNYHTLADFRALQGEAFDQLLTQSVAVLAKNNLISLEAVSQDGMRVRAHAGSSSFKRKQTLQINLQMAEMLIADLKEEAKKNPGACKTRIQAAQERAIIEKKENIKKALVELNEVRKSKIRAGKKEQRKVPEEELAKTRVSITDPDARIMKMADNGFRPAFNVQFATTNKGKAIIGVDVSKSGSDQKQTMGMIKQVEKRYNQLPKKWLQDGGYNNNMELEKLVKTYKDCKIYMPPKECKNESQSAQELRERMETSEAKEIYKERAATAEYSNAQARNHGLLQFLVRGLPKVKSVALLLALAHNMCIGL